MSDFNAGDLLIIALFFLVGPAIIFGLLASGAFNI